MAAETQTAPVRPPMDQRAAETFLAAWLYAFSVVGVTAWGLGVGLPDLGWFVAGAVVVAAVGLRLFVGVENRREAEYQRTGVPAGQGSGSGREIPAAAMLCSVGVIAVGSRMQEMGVGAEGFLLFSEVLLLVPAALAVGTWLGRRSRKRHGAAG